MRRIRLKYYLRALGTGIIVTALLMGYSQKEQAQLTDEEILQRVGQLDMAEQQGVLSDLAAAGETAAEESAEPEAAEQEQRTEETAAEESAATEEPEEETVTLVIVRGETSVSVSKALAEAGLVEDYQAYDSFLCSNGYDKSITTGTYEIPVNATYEEIAWIISKKR